MGSTDPNKAVDKKPEVSLPPRWVRFLFWPIVLFDWRPKLAERLATSRYTPIQYYSEEPVPSITPVPTLPLYLLGNGTVRFNNPQLNNADKIETHKHADIFEIHLAEDLMEMEHDRRGPPPMKEPIVSSDGRYVHIRRRQDGKISRVVSFDGERWFEWRYEKPATRYSPLLFAGLQNYNELGKLTFRRIVIASVLLLVIIAILEELKVI